MYQSQLIHVVTAIAPNADLFDTAQTTDWLTMKNYDSLMFVIQIGVGATGTATITVKMASDSSGTGATAIPFSYRRVSATGTSDVEGALTDATSAGFTTTAGSNQVYIVEVNSEELDASKPFVALTATEVVNSPVAGAILAIMGEPRYPGSTHLTAIA
jgi:hypothetical protein